MFYHILLRVFNEHVGILFGILMYVHISSDGWVVCDTLVSPYLRFQYSLVHEL